MVLEDVFKSAIRWFAAGLWILSAQIFGGRGEGRGGSSSQDESTKSRSSLK